MKKLILLFTLCFVITTTNNFLKAQTSCAIDTNGHNTRLIEVWGLQTTHQMSAIDTTGYGIFYTLVNDTVTLYGLKFYATLQSSVNVTVPVAVNVYSSDPSQIPIALLATDTVNVDTFSAIPPDTFNRARIAQFPSPIVLTGDFVVTIEAASDSIVSVDFAPEFFFLSRGKFNPGSGWGYGLNIPLIQDKYFMKRTFHIGINFLIIDDTGLA